MAEVKDQAAQGAATGAMFGGPVGAAIGLGAGALIGGLSGGFGPSEGFKQRQFARDQLALAGRHLAPGKVLGDFQQFFSGLSDAAAPQINQLVAGAQAGGAFRANQAAANASRLGLGESVFGGLAGGLRAGGIFGGNQIRANILNDFVAESFGAAQSNRQLLAQGAISSIGAAQGGESAGDRAGNALSLIGQFL